MKNYKNGRPAKLNDRVVTKHNSGIFIGTLVNQDSVHLQVAPLFYQGAFYVMPGDTLHIDDALRTDSEVPPFTAEPVVTPAPAAAAVDPVKVDAPASATPAAEAALGTVKPAAAEPVKA